MRRPATSNTQYSTMPARAYRPALVLRSKPSVESATSTTSWRSTGRGFSSVKWEKSRFRTIRSGSGSLVGLSSGETSIGDSGITRRAPKPPPSHISGSLDEFTCGRFFPILSISSPSISSSRWQSNQIVLKRDFSHFTDENPRPVDLQLVVEVADSTLGFDLKTKAGLYAPAGRSEE